MLRIRNLYAYYGSVTALSGVTCHIKEGEIVALIGANGAGKTTLLNAICGLVRKKGEVAFKGRAGVIRRRAGARDMTLFKGTMIRRGEKALTQEGTSEDL